MITELSLRISFHKPDELPLIEDFKKKNNVDNWVKLESDDWVMFETVKSQTTRKESE